MSRSQPTDRAQNPSTRWFEWNGESGTVRYYDKDEKKNVDVGSDFTFLLLDELSGVRGWHDHSQSGIYSNEVRDTRTDILTVKAFKGGTLSEGLYRDIKHEVNRQGGQFTANCYIAFKQGQELAIGAIRFKGAALGVWMEFKKQHRAAVYQQAIRIHGFDDGKKGRIIFRLPIFELAPIRDATQEQSKALDQTLQAFLSEYLAKNKRDQAEASEVEQPEREEDAAPLTEDDIPF